MGSECDNQKGSYNFDANLSPRRSIGSILQWVVFKISPKLRLPSLNGPHPLYSSFRVVKAEKQLDDGTKLCRADVAGIGTCPIRVITAVCRGKSRVANYTNQ